MFSTKTGAAGLSIASNSLLILSKVVVGIITGSISVIAEAIHSLLDLVAAVIAFFSVKVSDKPPDVRHPFGHGKIENVSGAVEAGLILVVSGVIINEAIARIRSGVRSEFVELGIVVMLVSIIVNVLVSRRLYKVSRTVDSLALEADAAHLTADVYSSLAVLAGLLVMRVTGLKILDPLVAIGVAIFILKIAYDLLRKSFGGLIDEKLPLTEEVTIKSCIMEHSRELVGFHALRTRKVGSQRHIDLHLVMPKHAKLMEAHQMCDHIEADIKARLPGANVTIHVEPCQSQCDQCTASCSLRWRNKQ